MIVSQRLDLNELPQSIDLNQSQSIVRLLTCGSVDDGKSSLIGRLLHDTKNVYDDQMDAIQNGTLNRSSRKIDLSLITDGLKAEREQGITIDVAYRYFSTPNRKYIIADTPGHEQYTRNMATGASTADVAIFLIDARHGVLKQSRRHAYICSLLGIRYAVVAINKMDLVGFEQSVFERHELEFNGVLAHLGFTEPYFVPVSALDGDNVVTRSERMPWFSGPSIIEYVEHLELVTNTHSAPFRFAVQLVNRPNIDFRGYSGRIASGSVQVGENIVVLPGYRKSRVAKIVTYDGDRDIAFDGEPVTLTLENELDIARGDLFVQVDKQPSVGTRVIANVVWMQDVPLKIGRTWLVKHTTRILKANVLRIVQRIDVNTYEPLQANELGLNEIGQVEFELSQAIYFDSYVENRSTGAFIVIDPDTNATAGAGMLVELVAEQFAETTSADRVKRFGHGVHLIDLGLRHRLAHRLERRLFNMGGLPIVIQYDANSEVIEALQSIGAIVIFVGSTNVPNLPENDEDALEQLVTKFFDNEKVMPGDYEV